MQRTDLKSDDDCQALFYRLRAAGLRPTRQRVALLRLLSRYGEAHVTARQIHADLRRARERMSLATVYNNLADFCTRGLIREVATCASEAIYDTRADPHHHIVNRQTGEVRDAAGIAYALPVDLGLRPGERIVSVEISVTVESA